MYNTPVSSSTLLLHNTGYPSESMILPLGCPNRSNGCGFTIACGQKLPLHDESVEESKNHAINASCVSDQNVSETYLPTIL